MKPAVAMVLSFIAVPAYAGIDIDYTVDQPAAEPIQPAIQPAIQPVPDPIPPVPPRVEPLQSVRLIQPAPRTHALPPAEPQPVRAIPSDTLVDGSQLYQWCQSDQLPNQRQCIDHIALAMDRIRRHDTEGNPCIPSAVKSPEQLISLVRVELTGSSHLKEPADTLIEAYIRREFFCDLSTKEPEPQQANAAEPKTTSKTRAIDVPAPTITVTTSKTRDISAPAPAVALTTNKRDIDTPANLPTTPTLAMTTAPTSLAPALLPAPESLLPVSNTMEQYNLAFGQFRRGDYGSAEISFRRLLQDHPDDSLSENAQYWLGESLFIRGDFKQASDIFRDGYQKYPKGSKTIDNMLKLGMSLGNLNDTKGACRTFSQLDKDYPMAPQNVKDREKSERKRIGC